MKLNQSKLLAYIAAPLLVVYLAVLLATTYYSQQRLHKAAHESLLYELKKQATALSYFYSERIEDAKRLAKERVISVFFSNRALGMSMQYGLRASLLAMQNSAKEFLASKELDRKSIYDRILVLDKNQEILLDEGKNAQDAVFWKDDPLTPPGSPINIRIGTAGIVYLSAPLSHREQLLGWIILEINQAAVSDHFVQNRATAPDHFTIIASGSRVRSPQPEGGTDHQEMPERSIATIHSEPIKRTPFCIYSEREIYETYGLLGSNAYLLALSLLALSLVILLFLSAKSASRSLRLTARAEEAEAQRSRLEDEVSRRKQSEAFIKTMTEAIPDLVWMKDRGGKYLFVNAKFERFFGAPAAVIRGRTDYDFVDAETAEAFQKHDLSTIQTGRPSVNEEWITYADDGHRELLETIKSPIIDDRGNLFGVLSVARDITQRKLQERKLNRSESRLKEAQQLAKIGNWELDFIKDRLFWSDEVFRIFELEPSRFEPSYQAFLDSIHPDDRDKVNDAYQRSLTERTPYSITHRLLIGDNIKYVQEQGRTEYGEDGKPLRSLGTVQDISERVEYEIQINRLNHLIEQSSESIFVIKVDGARFLDANQAACRNLGYSKEELLQLCLWDISQRLTGEDDWNRLLPKLIASNGRVFETTHRHRDGHMIPVEVSAQYLEEPEGALFIAVARDISERRQAERQLRLQAMVLDQIQDHVTVTDLHGGVIYVNAAEIAAIGHDREEILGQNVSAYGDDPEADATQAEIVRQTLAHGAWNGEVINIGKDGSRIVLDLRTSLVRDEEGNALAMVGVGTDITERKQAEQAILESSQRYKAVLSSSKDGFWVVDIQGRLVEVNEAYCRYSGFRPDELLTMSLRDLDATQGPAEIRQRIDQIVAQGGALFETLHRRKDGSLWPVEVSISYSPVQGGRFFCFLRDITERKESEWLGKLRQQLADMVYTDDQQQLLQAALDTAEQLTHSEIAFFHFIEKDQETVSMQTWSTRTLAEMCYAKGEGLHYPVSEAGVWVDCVYQRQPVIQNDYPSLPHKKGLPEGHAFLKRELTVPVFRDNRIVAVVGVGNKASDYDEKDASLLDRLADMTYDFIERKRAEQQIQYMAYNDVLTGLPNRQLFADRLEQAISLTSRSNKLLAICYLDLDGFKPVNDRYGHQLGDLLLIQFSNRLQNELRKGDTLARLGGDEFAILLNSLGTIYQSEEIVQRILDHIALPFDVDRHRIHISASIGITLYPHDDADPDTLLRHADQEMYKAKEGGKNTYSFYDPVEDYKMHAHRNALKEFDEALGKSQLVLHYQPRIDLRTGEFAGVEALARWQHPEKGLLLPAQFLPMIGDSPQEIALDEWVLQAALDQHMLWKAQGHIIPVSVNLSPRHIQQRSFPGFLKKLLASYPGDTAGYLELEVLETSAIDDTSGVAEVMNACEKLGVHFALDDFGTGYSSLTYFHRLPISILKIDQQFVRDMMINSRDQDIVEGVLRLANALKRPVVAEGVEYIELGYMLSQLGCQYAQGFGIARPMPAAELIDWSAQWLHDRQWHELSVDIQKITENYDLNVPIFIHYRWLNRVNTCLNSGTTAERPELDENNCRFTEWYKGIGSVRYGAHPHYAFILAKHTEVHKLAAELVASSASGLSETVSGGLVKLKEISDELISHLISLSER